MIKEKTSRNKKYLSYIRTLDCCLTSQHDPIAAHIRMDSGAGVGMKPSDYRVVPLSPALHKRQHEIGERTFWNGVGVDPVHVAAQKLFNWLISKHGSDAVFNSLEQLAKERS